MSYIICFWDKSRLQVDDSVGEKLKNAIRSQSIKTFDLGNNLYFVSGVEKIITKEESFNVFPGDWEQLTKLEDRSPTKETMTALEEANKNPDGLKKLEELKHKFLK